jgi:MFS family permease
LSVLAGKSTDFTEPGAAQARDFRNLGPWFLAEFLCSYAVNLYLVGCYDFATNKIAGIGASESSRLWVSAAWGFSYIFISLLAGRITEGLGPRRAAIAASSLSALTALAALIVLKERRLWILPLVMLPFNFTCTMIWPAIESGVTRSLGTMRLSSRIALFNLSWGLAGFVAIFTHGWLEEHAWWSVFVSAAAAFAAAAIILWRIGIPTRFIGTHNVPDDAAGEHELDSPGMRRRAQRFLIMAWLANGLAYTAIYVLFPIMTQLAKKAALNSTGTEASDSAAGMIVSVWFITRFIGFGLTSRWTGWHYKVSWLIAPLVLLAGTFFAMLTIHSLTAFLILQVFFGFCAALVFSGSLYYAMHVSSGHGGHAAFHEAVVGIGTTAGPVIGALAGTGELGPQALLRIAIGVTGVMAIGILAVSWLATRLNRPEGTPA